MIEIRFNWKSRGTGVEDAVKLATELGAAFEDKRCIVTFDSIEAPNLPKLLQLIQGIKGTELYVNEQWYDIKSIQSILDCRRSCNGICNQGIENLWLSNLRLSGLLENTPILVKTVDETGPERVKTEEWYADFDWNSLRYPAYLNKVSETETAEGTLETKFTFEREELRAEFFEETRLEAEVCPKYDKNKMDEVFNQFPKQMNMKRVTKILDRKYRYPL